ncbi:hypothetical protein [Paenibacillus aquistagni]|uniref:hypothetical protein n=1 Tax=Paenibacillus aquistagni TaxID=1852522 RepID=UPI00145A7EF8|nr:hypothetical protein [Paenibacillus aquistagni]NMM53968.1 hypothetical protein [Paenibacillus aquistagni]
MSAEGIDLLFYCEQDLQLIRSLPNRRWDAKGGVWRAPCSEQVLESLLLSYPAGTIRWHENVYQHPAYKQALQKEMRQEQSIMQRDLDNLQPAKKNSDIL